MPEARKAEIIRALFAAYLSNDRKAVEDSFTGDFRFTSPYDDDIDKATYFERCWKSSDWIERQDLERIVVEGDQAFVTYQCTARDGKRFRNTEFFHLRRRQDQTHRCLFRRDLQEWRVCKTAGMKLPSRCRTGANRFVVSSKRQWDISHGSKNDR